MKAGKRFRKAVETTGAEQVGDLTQAVDRLKGSATAKFDETVEVAMRLGVDPRHAEQQVRGTVVLPHGTGKKVRVLVLTKGEKEREAKEAGADYAGSEEWIKKLNEGWLDVDSIIATPDMMGEVGKLGRILGPRGLMPNPRSGTVTMDVAKAVREVKSGKIEYRVDKAGNLHAPVGKASFAKEQLVANVEVFLREVIRQKPPAAKGQYLRSAEALVCVYLGERPTTGWGLDLQTASLVDGELRILARETRPRGTVNQVVTYPAGCGVVNRGALPAGDLAVRADDTISEEFIVGGDVTVPVAEAAP